MFWFCDWFQVVLWLFIFYFSVQLILEFPPTAFVVNPSCCEVIQSTNNILSNSESVHNLAKQSENSSLNFHPIHTL